MEKKLGQDSAFPRVVINETVVVDEQTTQYDCEGANGISKRTYIAKGYADIAYRWAEDMNNDEAKELLGIPVDVEWNPYPNFTSLVVKLQFMLADEFLKQESNG